MSGFIEGVGPVNFAVWLLWLAFMIVVSVIGFRDYSRIMAPFHRLTFDEQKSLGNGNVFFLKMAYQPVEAVARFPRRVFFHGFPACCDPTEQEISVLRRSRFMTALTMVLFLGLAVVTSGRLFPILFFVPLFVAMYFLMRFQSAGWPNDKVHK